MSNPGDVERLIARWRSDPSIADNIVEWHTDPARPARLVDFPPDLHPAIVSALQARGISRLYSHQALSFDFVRQDKNVVITTGTASGKTLCYNLPILDAALRDPSMTALYFFPTRALTQDQKENLSQFSTQAVRAAGMQPVPVAVYDGDTPSQERNVIRKSARLLLTNPDMLHVGILPHHTLWERFFQNLRFVVIDEIHIYRGVFGSHVANLIRRLKRVAHFYGADPQFLLTSATIANPLEHASRLVEEPVEHVDEDGAPHGAKHFLLYNPPVVIPDLGVRSSPMVESNRLAGDLLAYKIQTLLFARTRRGVELLLKNLQTSHSTGKNELHGYRSGYLPNERRQIEQSLRRGDAAAVVATSALELGVDIGSAGAVVLVGYPGTIAATRQQAGRAGRRQAASVSILVASGGPLDQFLMNHPEYLFEKSPERALINADNLLILLQHIRCAAFELPFTEKEGFGSLDPGIFQEYLDFLENAGVIHRSGTKYFWMSDQYPATHVSLRSAGNDPVVLQAVVDDRPMVIGEVDGESATWMVHPQAIYLHEGRMYQVEDLNLEDHRAHLKPVDVDYYTEPRRQVEIEKLEVYRQEEVEAGTRFLGELKVTTQVIGYRAIRWFSHERLGEFPLDMPPSQLQTVAYWVSLNDEAVEKIRQTGLWRSDPINYGPGWNQLREQVRLRDLYTCQMCGTPESDNKVHHVHHIVPFRNFTSAEQANRLSNLITLCPNCHQRAETNVRMRSGLAGLGYVLQQLAPLFVMCDTGDLGAHTDPQSPLADGKATVVIYDMLPAGVGLSENLYDGHQDLMQQCLSLVQGCSCKDGCPGCVGPAGENGIGGKLETLALLAFLNGKQLYL